MAYMALYRKFRPKTFSQVKGQDHVVRTLKNQISNGRIGHAYLFTGTRGTGKTSVAKLFARAINCVNQVDGEPCNCCENCLGAFNDSMIDIVEVDAASNTGVEDIRRIIDEVQYAPVKGKYKVYIVDEVHMLTTQAFNAFLKTLEEPPSYAVFILATTEPHKLPITILSRCQRYDFKRISNEIISENLENIVNEEGLTYEKKALNYIARMGDGSMRDAISLLDKCIAFSLGERITYDTVLNTLGTVDAEVFSNMLRGVLAGNAVNALNELENAVNEGKDIVQFASDFLWYLRNILIVKADFKASENILGLSSENIRLLEKDATITDENVLMRYIRIMSDLLNNIKYSASKQILAEVALVKMAKPEMETDYESLLDRVRQLEMAPVQQLPKEVYKKMAPEIEMAAIRNNETEEQVLVEYVPDDEKNVSDIREDETAEFQCGTIETDDLWTDVADACQSRFLKAAIKKSQPVRNGEKIDIYATGTAYEEIKGNTEIIEELIKQVCGQNVKAHAVEGEHKIEKEEKDSFSLENLLENINCNIGTEES